MKKSLAVFTTFIFIGLLFNKPLVAGDTTFLYAVTSGGGEYGNGTLLRYNYVSDELKVIKYLEAVDGRNPSGSMVMHSNGKMYGLCPVGGVNNDGVVFEFDPATETYTKKLDLIDSIGWLSLAGFTEGSNGKLYTLVGRGGANDRGVLAEYDPGNNIWSVKANFSLTTANSPGRNSLVHAANGKLYAALPLDSNGTFGALIEYDYLNNIFTQKHSFNLATGYSPKGSMVLANNNKLYGALSSGGTHDYGAIYEYDPATDTYTTMVVLDSANTGGKPTASPIKASNGKLYIFMGMGGAEDAGTLVEYVPGDTTAAKKVDLQYVTHGAYPWNELLEVEPGLFYSLIYWGGNFDFGTLVEYNLNTNTLTKKADLDSMNLGAWPNGFFTPYVKKDTDTGVEELQQLEGVSLYPNPVSEQLLLKLNEVQPEINLVITDAKGLEVTTYYFEHKRLIELNVHQLPEGVYFLQLSSPAYNGVKKFVKH